MRKELAGLDSAFVRRQCPSDGLLGGENGGRDAVDVVGASTVTAYAERAEGLRDSELRAPSEECSDWIYLYGAWNMT